MLKPILNAQVLLEVFEENPFLARFYQDRERYAFQTQTFFLLSRYHQQHEAIPAALERAHLISDYTFDKNKIFARLTLGGDELEMYERVQDTLGARIPTPDLTVYLRCRCRKPDDAHCRPRPQLRAHDGPRIYRRPGKGVRRVLCELYGLARLASRNGRTWIMFIGRTIWSRSRH